jgi:hypothetical protein
MQLVETGRDRRSAMGTSPARVPCEDRPGVRRYRFEQCTRGNEIVVWLIPADETVSP